MEALLAGSTLSFRAATRRIDPAEYHLFPARTPTAPSAPTAPEVV